MKNLFYLFVIISCFIFNSTSAEQFSLNNALASNLNDAQFSEQIYRIVSNLQVGYFCPFGLDGQKWLLKPAGCGLMRTRAMWLDANSFETLINYKDYFGVRDFSIDDGLITTVLANQLGIEWPYAGKQGNDDRLWWALTYIRAYQYNSQHKGYLEAAKQIFNDINANYWDGNCGGGVWWDLARTYKNAITNELFLDAAVNLYKVTHNQYYRQLAEKEASWLLNSGMINDKNLIADGLNKACRPKGYTYTYNQGVLLDGFAELTKITNNRRYLVTAQNIISAVYNPKNGLVNSDHILLGSDGGRGSDGEAFNGIFMRHLSYFVQYAPNYSKRIACDFIEQNAKSAMHMIKDTMGGPVVPFYWYNRPDNNHIDSTTTFAAVDLFNAAKECKILGY